MKRPKISVFIAASLDGYIAKENGEMDWLEKFNNLSEDYGFHQFFASIDAIIVGRKTFEPATKGALWPFPGKRVVVLSNTVESVAGPKTEVFKGELTSLLAKLHDEQVKHVWVDGGITIAQFLREQLVDMMTVTFVPVLLGGGVPLFLPTGQEFPCHLLTTKAYQSGMVQMSYQIGNVN
jgi:dihydrofolate reductase